MGRRLLVRRAKPQKGHGGRVKYRKIDTRMWGDEKFRRFTDDGKLGFIFLLTHPALTSLGAMRGTMDGLAAELGWSPRRLRTALAPAMAHKMVEINEAVTAAPGSWGGQRPSLAPYFRMTEATSRVTARRRAR
jgi:hypothetical protein